jgi:hypothetical protein
LLPSRTPPISRSLRAISRLTRLALRLPRRSSWCMRAREAAVSAVSEPENSADSTSSSTIATTV